MKQIKTSFDSNPIVVDPHYTPAFYAELWGLDAKTVKRWFEDMEGVLKLGNPSKNRRTRSELRIPWSVAWKVYMQRSH